MKGNLVSAEKAKMEGKWLTAFMGVHNKSSRKRFENTQNKL